MTAVSNKWWGRAVKLLAAMRKKCFCREAWCQGQDQEGPQQQRWRPAARCCLTLTWSPGGRNVTCRSQSWAMDAGDWAPLTGHWGFRRLEWLGNHTNRWTLWLYSSVKEKEWQGLLFLQNVSKQCFCGCLSIDCMVFSSLQWRTDSLTKNKIQIQPRVDSSRILLLAKLLWIGQQRLEKLLCPLTGWRKNCAWFWQISQLSAKRRMLLSFLTSLLLDSYASQSLGAFRLLQQTENGWQLSLTDAGIRWFILSPERHKSEASFSQALTRKGTKQSRFHQLQPTETTLPRRKNIILYHIILLSALQVKRPVCKVPCTHWSAVGTVSNNTPPNLLFQGTLFPQFEALELVIINLLAHSPMT